MSRSSEGVFICWVTDSGAVEVRCLLRVMISKFEGSTLSCFSTHPEQLDILSPCKQN